MAKGKFPPPGTFLRIPLADGSFGYGRSLFDPYVAFYSHRTTEPSQDLEEIASKPILFRQAVRFDLRRWVPIGVRELTGDAARPVVNFRQDHANLRQCTIYESGKGTRSATPEECVALERAAVWDAHHIEQRLLDTFMGRPNQIEISMRVELPKAQT